MEEVILKSDISDPLTIHIVAVFLLLEIGWLLMYVFERVAITRQWWPLKTGTFVAVAAAAVAACAGFLFGLWPANIDKAMLAFSLGCGAALSVLHPVMAVSFFLCNLLLRPWELMPDVVMIATLPRALAIVSMLSWLVLELRHRRLHFLWNRTWTIFMIFLGWVLAASIFAGQFPEGPIQFMELFLPIVVTSFLVFNCTADWRDLKLILGTLIIAVLGNTVAGISYTIRSPIIERLTGGELLGNPNDMAALIVLVLPFLLFAPVRRRGWQWAAAGPAAAVLLVGIYMAESRGAKLAIAGMGAVYLFACMRVTWKRGVLAAAAACLVLVVLSGSSRSSDDLQTSTSSRYNYVLTGVRMIVRNPLFGVGLGNYPKEYENYTLSFDEWGQRTAHSSWVLVMSETGIPGLLLFGLLFCSVLSRAWRMRQRRPEFLLAMVGYGITMSLLSHTYLFAPYILFAVVLVGWRVYGEGDDAPARGAGRVPRNHAGRGYVHAAVVLAAITMVGTVHTAAAELRLEGTAGADKPVGPRLPALQKTVQLKGARGEVLNLLLRLDGVGCGTLAIGKFQTKSKEPGTFPIRLFRMEPITTEYPSFPGAYVGRHYDPLAPLPLEKGRCVKEGAAEWIFGELEIPPWAAPGEYTAELRFGEARLPIELKVWRMRMPAEHAFPLYTEMSTWYNLKGHYGKWEDREAELAEKYRLELLAHRMIDLSTNVIAPPVQPSGNGYTLDLRNQPNAKQSFYQINIRNRPPWALLGFPAPPHADMKKEATAHYFAGVESVLPELNRPGKAVTFLWDEPQEQDIPALAEYCTIVRKEAPALKILSTVPNVPALKGLIDIYVPVINSLEDPRFGGLQGYRGLQKEGRQVWTYVSCMSHGCGGMADPDFPDFVLDRPASYIRSIAWLGHKYGLDGFLYYFVNYAYQFYPQRDPWKTVWDFTGNGDGTLFYPGRPGEHGFTEQAPAASLRMKIWREASFDAEYLQWMKTVSKPPSWWKSEFDALVPGLTGWSRDYQGYRHLRDRIGEFLDSQQTAESL